MLAGACYGLSFPPYGIAPLAWPAVGLLVATVRASSSLRQALACGALAAATACALGYHWIAQTAHDFGMVSWPMAILALLVFAVIGELNLTMFTGVVWLLRRWLGKLPAAWTAACFTAIEYALPKIFPDVLAHSHIDVPWFASGSALFGQFGLGFVVAWVSVALCDVVMARTARQPGRRGMRLEAAVAMAVAVAITLYGGVRYRSDVDVRRTLDVVMLQTQVGDPIGLVDDGAHPRVLDSLVSLYVDWTVPALEGGDVDLIVWPETSVPAGPEHGAFYRVQRLAIETGIPVVTGGYDFWRDTDDRWRIYNTLFQIDAQGRIVDRYHKNMLIPIGEAIPFEKQWPQLRAWLPNAGQFTPGPGPQVMDVAGTLMAPLICYELIFPAYVRRSLFLGGEVLLNVSNDYWFGRSAEPLQHLSLARMRAYETGRPIIRCTNTGISALIDGRGRITHRTGIWQRETLRGTIDVPAIEWTPYARWGERTMLVFVLLACAMTAVFARLGTARR